MVNIIEIIKLFVNGFAIIVTKKKVPINEIENHKINLYIGCIPVNLLLSFKRLKLTYPKY